MKSWVADHCQHLFLSLTYFDSPTALVSLLAVVVALLTIIAAVLPSHIEAVGHSVLRPSIDAPRGFGLTICAMHLDFRRFPKLTVCIAPQMRPGDTSFPVVQASWALSSTSRDNLPNSDC
jgi:hypothetical protein